MRRAFRKGRMERRLEKNEPSQTIPLRIQFILPTTHPLPPPPLPPSMPPPTILLSLLLLSLLSLLTLHHLQSPPPPPTVKGLGLRRDEGGGEVMKEHERLVEGHRREVNL